MIKNIYILWLQGFDKAPWIVKKCLESWKLNNPNWNIVQLDQNNLQNYVNVSGLINGIENKSISHASLSDIIRISLLKKFGGLWVDATTYCTKPLDAWLDNYIGSGFFAFSFKMLPDFNPDKPISSWFIYGGINNYIIEQWYNKTISYSNKAKKLGNKSPFSTKEEWKKGNTESHYFWFHYLFQDLYDRDQEFQQIWDNIPKLSETGPHFLQRNGMLNESNDLVKNHIDNKMAPLYKLTYRFDDLKYNSSCNLHYLLESNRKEFIRK